MNPEITLVTLMSLLRSALWGTPLEAPYLECIRGLDEDGWSALLEAAQQQTVSGLLYQAAERFPEDITLSEAHIMQLMESVNKVVNRNHLLASVEEEAMVLLHAGGLHPLVLKGSTCAARYPAPELRASGDIDLYLPEAEFPVAVELLRVSGYPGSDRPDGSVELAIQGCTVELHRRYYDLDAPAEALPPVPSPEAELVMLSSHILKHACGVGVGLRQICDFALAWHQFTGDRAALEEHFQRLGLGRWNRLLLSFIQSYLDPSVKVRPLNPQPLLRIILAGGNFGHYAAARQQRLERSPLLRKADTALRLLGRLPFSLRYAPHETWGNLRQLIQGNLKH